LVKPSLDEENKTRVAGIILAAGESSRFGKPKAFLDWFGEPFIRVVTRTAILAGLSPVVVVGGAEIEAIQTTLVDLPVFTIHNPNWQEGMSSSLRWAIQVLPENVNGGIFFLVDQPQIPVELIKSMIEKHTLTQADYVAPIVNGSQGNPVLFDRRTFPELIKIKGDRGGRSVFHLFTPAYVQWDDKRILLDVDLPEDYPMLVNLFAENSLD